MWVVHRHEITYVTPAGYADELRITTRVEDMRGARAVRQTTIERTCDQRTVAEIVTEWVWVRASDGRPMRLPRDAIVAFGTD
ncbi:MAG: hypothetical protein JOY61_07995 [Chloroflexi bacterium]|nr:hypothetical protein [Chloroflexota bacterium]